MKRIITFFLIIFISFTAFTLSGYAQEQDSQAWDYEVVKGLVQNNYIWDLSEEQLYRLTINRFLNEHPEYVESFIRNMFSALDENSQYFSYEDYNRLSQSIAGKYGGIGIFLGPQRDRVVVASFASDSPAKRAGLSEGDVIVEVDGEDITKLGFDEAVAKIKGEAGTVAKIGVERNGAKMFFEVDREEIKESPVSHTLLEPTIGYVKISMFNENTAEYFEEALADIKEKGAQNLIIDLRNNPGGEVMQAVRVVGKFLEKDMKVVSLHFRETENDKEYFTEEDKPYTFNIAVLVNENSASAAEIVAGAVKDYELGKLIGNRTYGKGSVQQMYDLGESGMKLTVALYATPKGTLIDKEGIQPDIAILNKTNKPDLTGFLPMDLERKMKFGDSGEDVLAIKQRLNLLGYKVSTETENFDQELFDAICQFQYHNKLYVYGVADYTTQNKIIDVVDRVEVSEDTQLNRAIWFLKGL